MQLTCAYPLPRENSLGNLSACTELESLLGSTPAESKVHRHDSDVELICRTMPSFFVLMQVHDHLCACFLERRELWDAKMNYTNSCILFRTWKVRLSNWSRSSVELISWIDPYLVDSNVALFMNFIEEIRWNSSSNVHLCQLVGWVGWVWVRTLAGPTLRIFNN